MKPIAYCSLIVGLLLVTIVLLASATSIEESAIAAAATSTGSKARSNFELPALFNFKNYKKLFNKRYNSIIETLTRQKIFLGKAFRSFLSGVAYKFRSAKFYLAVNEFSDWTAKEVEAIKSKIVLKDDLKAVKKLRDISKKTHVADEDEIKQKLDEIKRRANEPGYDAIAEEVLKLENNKFQEKGTTRRKRDAVRRRRKTARDDFSMSRLIESNSRRYEDPKVMAKVLRNPRGNNPRYQEPEMVSYGTKESVAPPLDMSNVDENQKAIDSAQIDSLAAKLDEVDDEDDDGDGEQQSDAADLPDEVLIDHRTSNCFFKPHSQGHCASCYAFAVNAYLEWAMCKETGKLMRLSEQYIVDCGSKVPEARLEGCLGGNMIDLGIFMSRYGLELAKNYPYLAEQNVCPFDDPKKAGYLRTRNSDNIHVAELEEFEDYLNHGPIVINIGTSWAFLEYGGGVHDGLNCCEDGAEVECGGHSVLLIGMGREDGQEYWLIRNSAGENWGEEGYYKLSKEADCIHPRAGVMYATEDGRNITLFARETRSKH